MYSKNFIGNGGIILKKHQVSSSIIATVLLGSSLLGGGLPAFAKSDVMYNSDWETPSYMSETWKAPKKVKKQEIVWKYLSDKSDVLKVQGKVENQFELLNEIEDKETDTTHYRLREVYKGVPVYGSDQTVHLNEDGDVTSFFGQVVPTESLEKVKTTPKLKEKDAIKAIKKDLKKEVGEVEEFSVEPEADLFIYPQENKVSLAYVTEVTFLEPEPGRWFYAIDAQNGKVLDKYNIMEHVTKAHKSNIKVGEAVDSTADARSLDGQADEAGSEDPNALGTGKGVLGDTKTFQTTYANGTYSLKDTTRGKGVETYTARNGTSYMYPVTSTNNTFNDPAAVDAHAYAGKVYDYYKSTFNRDSFDNAGAKLNSIVHYSTNYNNAFWDGSEMVYGDGDGKRFISLSGGLDVIAHELTHAVTERTAGLIYRNESGALNESISDIFGAMVDRDDWEIGEDIFTPDIPGDALRSLSDPAKYNHPDHLSKKYTGTGDNGGVHTNSGINNKAAYLISEGGTHYGVTVEGVGREATEKIYYRALTVYLTSTSTFAQMRQAAINAATDLFGADSAEVEAVKDAYKAVGIN